MTNRAISCFDAVVLAGERKKASPLLSHFGVPTKSLIKVAGEPMISRVVHALMDTHMVERIFLCGEDKALFRDIPFVASLMDSGQVVWVQNEKGPSLSAYKALNETGAVRPVLLTTSDHALLAPEHVRFFCDKALSHAGDLAVGLANMKSLSKYPQVRRTSYKFKNGIYCTCNLFGFLNRRSFEAARFWVGLEEKRKNPVKVVMGFGIIWALRFILGNLSLNAALGRASRVIGCKIEAIIMPYGEAALDVDTLEDWKLVQQIATSQYQP